MHIRTGTMTAAVALALAVSSAAPALAQSRDQIRIVGSSTVFPFATTVAETFGNNTSYKTPVIESTGSGGGLRLFCSGLGVEHPDITNSSRRIKASEIETCAENGVTEITEVKIGFDGIVLANSNQAPTYKLTIEEIWLALAEKVPMNGELVENPYTRWNEIDAALPDADIEVLGPPPTSGTRDAFVELVMEEACESFDEVNALGDDAKDEVCAKVREDGVFIEAGENDNLIVQRLEANPNAIGIFGYSFLDQNSDKIHGSVIGGVEPTFDNIAAGDYPVSRSLYFYVKNAHVGVIPGLRDYIAEFVSENAVGPDGYLADKGLIPLPDDDRAMVRENATALSNDWMADFE